MKQAIAFVVALIGLAAPAAAEQPVAIVEEVQGNVTGAEFMDYVVPGKVIKLGPTGSIVISYMKSCWRETISGIGTVIIGKDESMVHLADVKAAKTDCDAVHSHATARETSEVAATIVRSMGAGASITPQVTLYGASPLVEARGRGTLVIDRLDASAARQEFKLSGSQLKGRFFDLAGSDRSLAPGGTYVATYGSNKIVFRIDPGAKPGATPIVGRLLRME